MSDRTEATIVAEQLSKTYQMGDMKVEALRGVSFSITPGEMVAIMGPSGSGKSTAMNLLGCLDTPTNGTYKLDGQNVAGLNEDALAAIRLRKIGFVFQAFNLLPRMSALEQVELPLMYAGASNRRGRALEALTIVGLADRVDHSPVELSGGQQQRVAVARALVSRPEIVFADEPTGNLDSVTGGEVLNFLRGAVDNLGQTLVVVTHDAGAAAMADRVLFLADGQIVDEMTNPDADQILDRIKAIGG